jgi:two-component system response regulator PilR (NtrC family)
LKPRVLIVDDDLDIRETLQLFLELNGYEVHALRDGIAATTLDVPYDVIMVDLKMPVFDGERLIDYWLMTDPDLLRRVIVMSSYSHYAAGRSFHAYAVVPKPFDTDNLLRVVAACAAGKPADVVF